MLLPSQTDWTPGPFALECDVFVDPQDRMPASVAARHPSVPFVRHLDDAPDLASALQRIALGYLNAVTTRFSDVIPETRRPLFASWLSALARESSDPPAAAKSRHSRFGWLPLAPPNSGSGHPMVSFWFDDRTVVLLASERLGSSGRSEEFRASGFGLRVVGHVRRSGASAEQLAFCITGFSASLPYGEWLTGDLTNEESLRIRGEKLGATLEGGAETIRIALDLYNPVFNRLRIRRAAPNDLRFEAQGISFDYAPAALGRVAGSTPYAFHVRGTADDDGTITSLQPLERVALVAYATDAPSPLRAFKQDPASQGPSESARRRRPTRPEYDPARPPLDPKQPEEPLNTYLADIMAPAVPVIRVKTGTLLRPKPPAPPVAGRLRSDKFGEASPDANLRQFVARMARYGIDAETYFRAARLRLNAVSRSGIRPGPGKDGNTVNARVSLGPGKKSFYQALGANDLPEITVHLAHADLSTRHRETRQGNEIVAVEYLSIAADPRWMWHEIGHVLLAASVGELEFPFAHSAGDALAAIALDPESRLHGTARGATFPWVFLTRRHDRCTTRGWSWSGAMHRPATLRANPDRAAFKGYWSEQILSSALFRLYRALGGDAGTLNATGALDPDPIARQAASDYSIYLIIKAIGLLGYAGAVPALRPDHFVSALIDADVGTETFPVGAAGPAASDGLQRVGGCAHKVIRWAFETQGLYAPPGQFTNGPGLPPAVDVFIADGRPSSDVFGYGETHYGPGSYAPVPLEWTPDAATPAPWHATSTAIQAAGSEVFVTVGNRGHQPAQNVEVRVWVHPCPGPDLPDWDGGSGWTPCTPMPSAPQLVAAQDELRFGPFTIPATVPRPLVILAAATCADDRANVDTDTALPCASLRVCLPYLVAGDNNLGLRYVSA